MQKDEIARILRRARRELHYTFNGTLLSSKKGEGFDFAELQPYTEGIDAKKIYWSSLAKGGGLQYKRYFEEQEIYAVVSLFLDGSLCFGESPSKLEKAVEAAAWLGYRIVESGNIFQGVALSQKGKVAAAPSKKRSAVESFIADAAGIDPLLTELDYAAASEWLFGHVMKKSLIFLVGDFLEIPDLGKLARRHQLYAIVIRDRFELDPGPLGECSLTDPQNGKTAELFFDRRSAAHYREKFRAHDARLQHYFRRHNIFCRYLPTDRPTGSMVL